MARANKIDTKAFTHGANFRNDIRVKAIRRKFGFKGYSVLCFLMEIISDSENYCIEYNATNKDLLAADFDISTNELEDLILYFTQINILNLTFDNKLYSKEISETEEEKERKYSEMLENKARAGRIGMGKRWNKEKENVKNINTQNNIVITDDNRRITDDNTVIKEETKEQQEENEEKERTKEKEDKEEKKEKKEEVGTPKGVLSTFVDATPSEGENDDFMLKSFKEFFNGEVECGKCLIGGIRAITGKRLTVLKARAREYGEAALKEAVQKAVKSDFLNGKNNKGFVASFDWIMRPNNFPKVLEGNYDNNKIPPHGAKDMHRNGQILHTDNMDYTTGLW